MTSAVVALFFAVFYILDFHVSRLLGILFLFWLWWVLGFSAFIKLFIFFMLLSFQIAIFTPLININQMPLEV